MMNCRDSLSMRGAKTITGDLFGLVINRNALADAVLHVYSGYLSFVTALSEPDILEEILQVSVCRLLHHQRRIEPQHFSMAIDCADLLERHVENVYGLTLKGYTPLDTEHLFPAEAFIAEAYEAYASGVAADIAHLQDWLTDCLDDLGDRSFTPDHFIVELLKCYRHRVQLRVYPLIRFAYLMFGFADLKNRILASPFPFELGYDHERLPLKQEMAALLDTMTLQLSAGGYRILERMSEARDQAALILKSMLLASELQG